MIMGPWIHVLHISAIDQTNFFFDNSDQTNLNQRVLLVEEVLPRNTDVVGG
jgi:hypothetical protein